jgi:hypothetical protein
LLIIFIFSIVPAGTHVSSRDSPQCCQPLRTVQPLNGHPVSWFRRGTAKWPRVPGLHGIHGATNNPVLKWTQYLQEMQTECRMLPDMQGTDFMYQECYVGKDSQKAALSLRQQG